MVQLHQTNKEHRIRTRIALCIVNVLRVLFHCFITPMNNVIKKIHLYINLLLLFTKNSDAFILEGSRHGNFTEQVSTT